MRRAPIALMLALFLGLALTACGDEEDSSAPTTGFARSDVTGESANPLYQRLGSTDGLL